MSRDRHARVKEVFLAAVDLPAEERAAYLDRGCGGDLDLRAEVEGMLAFDADEPAFLEGGSALAELTRAADRRGRGDDDSSSRGVLMRLGDRIGRESRYEVQGEFARGGMGAILRVWDRDLRRSLAMKVVLDRSTARKGEEPDPIEEAALGRFLEEAQVTGQLDHPGVVPVHELGLDAEGRVFFTMKLVKGRDLKEIFDLVRAGAEGWTQTRALGVILKVCDAMAYAHSKRVIHRDLKPANIMVGRFGEVYVMDWGLAHVAGQRDSKDIRVRPVDAASLSRVRTDRGAASDPDSPLVTMDGDVVGTPAFMSPEQARGEIVAMGPASDVYSLGAILYQLLAGHMPYVPSNAKLNAHAVWALAQQGPPAPVTEVAPKAPEELVAICEKAMARAPSERYPDMGEMAEDLRAYVEGRVVKAHRTGALAELKKWVGRNGGLASALVAAAVLLIAGTVTSSYLYVAAKANEEDARDKATDAREAELRANREAARANAEAQRANKEASRANAETVRANSQAARAERSALEARKQSYLASFRAATISFEAGNLAATRLALTACEAGLRGWEWERYDLLERLARRGWSRPLLVDRSPSRVSALAFSPDDSVFATASESSDVRLWDALTGAPLATLPHAAEVLALAFRPDGERLVSASASGVLRVWDCRSGAVEATLEGHTAAVSCVAYTADGENLLSGSEDGCARLWDAETGAPLAVFLGHEGGVRELAPLAGGRRLATVSRQGVLRLWDAASRTLLVTREMGAFAAGPGLARMAYSIGADLHLCDAESGAVVATLEGHSADVYRIAFSPDGARLVSAAWDETVRLWDPVAAEAIAVLPGHTDFVSEIAFGADRPLLATASWDRTVRLWDSRDGKLVQALPTHPKWVNRVAVDSVGSRVLSASAGQVRLWDGVGGVRGEATVTWHTGGEVRALSYASAGATLVTAGADGAIGVWNAVTGAELTAVPDPCRDSLVGLWEARTGEALACGHEHDVAVVAHDAGGSRVAAACSRVSGATCLWDRGTGRLLANLQPADSGWGQKVEALAFSGDGALVVSAVSTGRLHVWNTADGELLHTLGGDDQSVTGIAFDPGGARFVSCSMDGKVRRWDAASGGVLPLESPPPVPVSDSGAAAATRGGAVSVACSPDGSRIVAGFAHGALGLWDGTTGEFLSVLEGHVERVTALGFSPSGTRIFSGSLDNTVRLWDAEAGKALAVLTGFVPEVVLDGAADDLSGGPLEAQAGPEPSADGADGEDATDWQDAFDAERAIPTGVTAVAFSPDGSRVVAAFVDGAVRTWLADPGDARAAWVHSAEMERGR